MGEPDTPIEQNSSVKNDPEVKPALESPAPPSQTSNFNDAQFKKPSFIGPKRGAKVIKKPLKPTVEADVTQEEINIEEKSDAKSVPNKSKDFPPLPYEEPIWKGTAQTNYILEELKSGVIQKTVTLEKKSFVVFGRVECCDIVMAHPTISRYHAVLQYRGVPDGEEEKGFYLYDLESTHGTFLNKARLKPRLYVRVRVGHMIKLGCSTRFFLLQGPEDDQEAESELSFTELKEKRRQELLERKRQDEAEERLREEEEEKRLKMIEERGISWGIDEDAVEEDDLAENPYAVTTNEELYIEDPKKALRQWFEREGEEMQLETEQVEKGMMICKIVLPLDDERGQDMTVEASARTKREAQSQCCLEACRIIDRLGLFKQSKQETKKRQTRNWEENDYYDSDEDSFLDRTGDLDVKRQKRMKKVGKIQESVETYDSLMEKHAKIMKELEEAEVKLQKLMKADRVTTEEENEEVDALDAFMKNLKNNRPSKLDMKIAKDEVAKLKKEEEHLTKLINIVKPTSMPELKPAYSTIKKNVEESNISVENVEKKVPKTKSRPITAESGNGDIGDEPKTKKRVLGPAMPPDPAFLPSVSESASSGSTNAELKVKKNKPIKPKNKPTILNEEVETEDDFTNLFWQPPKGQTGDGRTSLNDKLGY